MPPRVQGVQEGTQLLHNVKVAAASQRGELGEQHLVQLQCGHRLRHRALVGSKEGARMDGGCREQSSCSGRREAEHGWSAMRKQVRKPQAYSMQGPANDLTPLERSGLNNAGLGHKKRGLQGSSRTCRMLSAFRRVPSLQGFVLY